MLLCTVSCVLKAFQTFWQFLNFLHRFLPRVQWRLCPTQSLQFCGTGQVFGVQSSLTQHRSQLASNCLDHVTMSLCIIFLRMKGGERFRTSDLNTNRESDFCFDSSFFVVVFEEVGLCHAGCRCNPAAFWSQRSSPAYAVYDGVCVEPVSDLNRGTFLSCRPRLLQITGSTTAVWSH